jgi:hypothetical protein
MKKPRAAEPASETSRQAPTPFSLDHWHGTLHQRIAPNARETMSAKADP